MIGPAFAAFQKTRLYRAWKCFKYDCQCETCHSQKRAMTSQDFIALTKNMHDFMQGAVENDVFCYECITKEAVVKMAWKAKIIHIWAIQNVRGKTP